MIAGALVINRQGDQVTEVTCYLQESSSDDRLWPTVASMFDSSGGRSPMAAGNRSILVVLDSRRRAAGVRADETVFAALDHFGVAWEVLEGGDYMSVPPGHIAPRAAYLLAHDGAGAWLSPPVASEIVEAVRQGAGLLSLDREVEAWPEPLRSLLPAELTRTQTTVLRFPSAPGFITFGHQQDKEVELLGELTVTCLPADEAWRPLAITGTGEAAMAARSLGEGRVVFLGTGDRLYSEDVYGHVRGLDGLLWRSIVWVAAKPFPMRCVPPYVTARMDDCNGTYCAFGYVDVMNRFGIRPNLGLFIDELGPTDWAAAKRLFDLGGADFSMHAFRDDFYKARSNYRPYAVLADKPDLSNGGRDTRFEGLSLDHVTGRELDDQTVARNFARMDEAFARAGIRHSRVLNAHYGEIGWRAVSGFLQRGVDFPCNNSVIGQLYGNQPVWRPRPYGLRGATGRAGLVIDRAPGHPGLTFIEMSVAHVGSTHMTTDILSGLVPFLGESDYPRVGDAAARGLANVTLGLDALAFGAIMTHEERIDAISPEDWETIITSIVHGLEGWDVEYAGREYVSVICKRLFDSRLVHADFSGGTLCCGLGGRTDGSSPLTVWENEGEDCVRRVVDVDGFEGFTTVKA